MTPTSMCYLDHRTGDTDHMNAHLTASCPQQPVKPGQVYADLDYREAMVGRHLKVKTLTTTHALCVASNAAGQETPGIKTRIALARITKPSLFRLVRDV